MPRSGRRLAFAAVTLGLAVLLGGAALLALQAGQVFFAAVGVIGAVLTVWALLASRDAA